MNYEVFLNRIDSLCKKKNIKKTIAFENCGIGKDFSGHIKKGSSPSIEKVESLAGYFDTSIDYLIGRANEAGELIKRTPENAVKCWDKIIARLSKSPSANQTISDQKSENIAKIIENLLEMTDEASEESLKYIEYLSQKGRYKKSSAENEAKDA